MRPDPAFAKERSSEATRAADIMASVREELDAFVQDVGAACRRYYGGRLVSVAVFGSVGRGTPGPDSDIDLLVVADGLPLGRLARVDEFRTVEVQLASRLLALRRVGVNTSLSPVLKAPDEIRHGSPLLFDMTEDARYLYDRGAFLATEIDRLRRRLAELGARRIWRGNAWLWDLKPDLKPGEVFDL
jgi:predicted nucleotidyltransferase